LAVVYAAATPAGGELRHLGGPSSQCARTGGQPALLRILNGAGAPRTSARTRDRHHTSCLRLVRGPGGCCSNERCRRSVTIEQTNQVRRAREKPRWACLSSAGRGNFHRPPVVLSTGRQVMVASCCPCVNIRYESARKKTKGESICRASEAGFSREQNEVYQRRPSIIGN
jgi:hypothetical protein